MTRSKPSWSTAEEWIDAAWEEQDQLRALLAVAAALSGQASYCPLPPGYRAVYVCADGSLGENAIVALKTSGEREDTPVIFTGGGFGPPEARPDWYLAPGETLDDAREGIRKREEAIARYRAEQATR